MKNQWINHVRVMYPDEQKNKTVYMHIEEDPGEECKLEETEVKDVEVD